MGDPANFAFTPALIHRDLSSEHILHDPASARLTGVIDRNSPPHAAPFQRPR